jgi:hypothetical protein
MFVLCHSVLCCLVLVEALQQADRPRSPTICLNISRNLLYVRQPGSQRTVEPQEKKIFAS